MIESDSIGGFTSDSDIDIIYNLDALRQFCTEFIVNIKPVSSEALYLLSVVY